jgi:hypothetical protein
MKKYLTFFLFCALLLPQISSAYSPETTHAGITEQIVELYNLHNSHNQINPTDKEIIIQGAINEDKPATRALNHFYDPVRNMGINNNRTAVVWATESNNGNKYTWQENIDKYVRGDRAGALLGLGHILHLIEDMTVPDHTRNDPHIGDGPSGAFTGASDYESWAKEHKNRQTMNGTAQSYFKFNYEINKLDSVEDYFDYLAVYSNNNYVSPDTIVNSIYQYDNPVVIEKKNGYAYGKDSYFNDKHKLYLEYYTKNNNLFRGLVDTDVSDYSVLEEYFPRLVKMAILSGVGVVELFFSEAEQAREKYLEEERIKQEEIARYEAEKNKKTTEGNFFVKLWYKTSYAVSDTASAIAGGISNTVTTVSSVVYNGSALALNSTNNFLNGWNYTQQELATIGAQKVEKVVTSASKKVVLYIKENSAKLFTPAVAYTPPQTTLTQLQVNQLIKVLLAVNNTSNINIEDKTEVKKETKKVTRSGGGGHRDPEPVPVIIPDEPEEEIIDPLPEVDEPEEEIIDPLPEDDEPEEDEPEDVIDITAPEVTFGPVLKCQDSISDEVCLIVATTSTIFDLSFLSTSTDISFYTISVDNGEETDFVTATTSDNIMSIELTEDYEYMISLIATDLSGNMSATTSAKIILSSWPISVDAFWSTELFDAENSLIILYNRTPYSIKLDNWLLVTENGLLTINLDGTISANGEYVLRNEESGVTEGVDQIYQGQIVRDDRFLYLKYFSSIMFESFLGIMAPM